MFATRVYTQGIQRLLAACDEDLLGAKHTDGKLVLDVTKDFYDGERVDQETLVRLFGQCTIANLVGRKTVDVAVEVGLIDPAHVGTVDGVPHAQYMTLM